ncbi:VOC family protein [Mucilaginibacter sp. Bleaf8]|uniref:VOC family protein n=1 Tax=Mucilaginibacter sp. Bleaf8 TaxID=2834430 RepID=UPI001BCDCDFB|nr:VOC family protein [Mucilaginibacter sp. Bleaf8]MBS7564963.1 VOC family protein [Mucilaginibacter sp. Bleaf8]
MANQIFVNIPVKDLNRSVEFFTKLGYTFNAQFTNENATSMIISDSIYVMLLVEPYFKSFTKTEICDTTSYNESIISLSVENREAVDDMVRKAVEAGATTPNAPQDHGFMYGHGFKDLDGHLWEYFYMDPTHVQPA